MSIEKERKKASRNLKIGISFLIALSIASVGWLLHLGTAIFKGLTG